jgi:hypothetical protein
LESWIIQKDCTMGLMNRARPLVFAVMALLTAGACTYNDETIPLPTTPAPVTTERFAGTLGLNEKAVHPFTIALSGGLLTVTLTAAGPPATIPMGLAVGTSDGTNCTILTNGSVTTPAGAAPQLSGTLNGGKYCVQVSNGNQAAPVTYAVTVTHY